MSGESNLTRVTVNLTPQAVDAMRALAEKTGLGKTDVINRALQVYAIVDRLSERSGGALTIMNSDGEQRIHIL